MKRHGICDKITEIGYFKAIFVDRSLKIWGRLDLTGGVNTYVSMQAHGVRALKDSPNTRMAKIILTLWLHSLI